LSLPYALREQTVRASRPAVVLCRLSTAACGANYPRIFKYLVAYCYFALARLSCFRRRCRRVRRCTDDRRPVPLHDHDSPTFAPSVISPRLVSQVVVDLRRAIILVAIGYAYIVHRLYYYCVCSAFDDVSVPGLRPLRLT